MVERSERGGLTGIVPDGFEDLHEDVAYTASDVDQRSFLSKREAGGDREALRIWKGPCVKDLT